VRLGVFFLVFAVCKAPSPEPLPDQDPIAALEQAAVRAARQGHFAESTGVYRRLAALRPTAPARCAWQNAIVHNTFLTGTKREQLEEIQRLAAVERTFVVATTVQAEDKQACRRVLRDLTAELLSVWNTELTMGCTAYSWDKWPLLEQLSHEFLADFPDDQKAPEVRGYLERLHDLRSR
jgi:hypothetical protein